MSARDPILDARINCLGLLNVLETSRKAGDSKVHLHLAPVARSTGRRDVEKLAEDHPSPLSPYAIHKLLGEHYLRFYQDQHGLAWTSLRYANVFGPRQNRGGEAGVVAIFTTKILEGEIPTINAYPDDPEGMSRDYVYVEDVARASVLALDKARAGSRQHRHRAARAAPGSSWPRSARSWARS